ncbi:unnamed protein product [Adineta ricciae]|nr:unnamed protein product [Adineta ricciae]
MYSKQTSNHITTLDALKQETTTFIKENDVTIEELNSLKENLRKLEKLVSETHNDLVRCDVEPLSIKYNSVLVYSGKNNYMLGGTLLCADYQMKLNEFYRKSTQKWQLIYKAQIDGFGAKDFHRCSDGKGPTMTIIMSKNENYLFGGYTAISWGSDNTYKKDPAAFLFTLRNPHDIQPTKFSHNAQIAWTVAHKSCFGPCFGGVKRNEEELDDIIVCSNANESPGSEFSFPSSYLDTTGRGETLFTGEKNFMVEDIEVYTPLIE